MTFKRGMKVDLGYIRLMHRRFDDVDFDDRSQWLYGGNNSAKNYRVRKIDLHHQS